MNSRLPEISKIFGRHFVSLSCVQIVSNSEKKICVFSGFVIEIYGAWIYITAGHILRDVRIAFRKGCDFKDWRFDDQTAGVSLKEFKGMAIPYDFKVDDWMLIEDEDTGLDYAAVVLDKLTCLGLNAGEISLLSWKIWERITKIMWIGVCLVFQQNQ